jgi:hypothetical protein
VDLAHQRFVYNLVLRTLGDLTASLRRCVKLLRDYCPLRLTLIAAIFDCPSRLAKFTV